MVSETQLNGVFPICVDCSFEALIVNALGLR
jgi:hypothetical protein